MITRTFENAIFPVMMLIGVVTCMIGATAASATPIIDLRFNDPGASIGDPFVSTSNAGSEAVTITGQMGTALPVYGQGPTGSKDLPITFNGEDSSNAGEDANYIQIDGFSGWDETFTLAFAVKLDSGNLDFGIIMQEKDGFRVSSGDEPLFNPTFDQTGTGVSPRSRHNALVAGQWHHVAITYEADAGAGGTGTTRVDIYIDGVLVDDITAADNVLHDVAGPLFWGGRDWHNARSINGSLDSIYYDDQVLTDTQIEQLSIQALVPEPGSLALIVTGMCAAWVRRRPA